MICLLSESATSGRGICQRKHFTQLFPSIEIQINRKNRIDNRCFYD